MTGTINRIGQWGSGLAAIARAIGGAIMGNTVFVLKPKDFGTPVNGVVTLTAPAYFVLGNIDLAGVRLEASEPLTVFGAGAEAVRVKSTGLTSGAVLKAENTLQLRTISFESEAGATCVELDASGAAPGANIALDWSLVNFHGDGLGARLNNFTNFIGLGLGFLGGDSVVVEGDVNTMGFTNTIFIALPGRTGIEVDPTAIVRGRLRLDLCAVVAIGSGVGIKALPQNFDIAESFKLEKVNFTAGGAYLDGIDRTSDRTDFTENNGIENSARLGEMYWSNNPVATAIAAAGTFVKAAGASTPNALNQRFSHQDGRLTYTSPIKNNFTLSATLSVASGTNNQVAFVFRKNGVEVLGAPISITTNSAGRVENAVLQTIVALGLGDYIEVFTTNLTNTTAVTVTALDVIVSATP